MISGSSTIAPTRMRGLSDEYGSWKTICMSRRASRSSSRDNARTSRPSNTISPDGRLNQPQDAPAGRRLPASGFADETERLAAIDREADVLDRGDRGRPSKEAAAAGEVLREVPHVEQRHQELSSSRTSGSIARLYR